MTAHHPDPKRISCTQQSHNIAVEHYLWAKRNGLSDRAILESIGLSAPAVPARGTVIDAIRRTWLALQCGWTIDQHQPPATKALRERRAESLRFEDDPRAVRAMGFKRAAE
jgi:hypothetical protein